MKRVKIKRVSDENGNVIFVRKYRKKIPFKREISCRYVNISKEVIESSAYWKLTATSLRVLTIFYSKRRFSKGAKRKIKRRDE